MIKEIHIPVSSLQQFYNSMEKLNKKAVKLNCSPITYSLKVNANNVNETFTNRYQGYDAMSGSHYEFDVVFQTIIISYEDIKLNGYELIGFLTKKEDIILRHALHSDYEKFVSSYEHNNFYCEYCKSNRDRNSIYLINNISTNEIKQVGSTCLKDFTGHANPEQIANFYTQALCTILGYVPDPDSLESYSNSSSDSRNYICTNLIKALAIVINLINLEGYISRQREFDTYEPCVSTVTKAWDLLQADKNTYTDLDIKEANECLNYILNNKHDNTYLVNVQEIARAGYITNKTYPLFLSSPCAYRKHLTDKSKENKSNSTYQHSINEKVSLTLTVTNSIPYTNSFNNSMSYINIMQDNAGNIYKWFTSKNLYSPSNNIINIKGTVKSHEDFKGEKSTILTRCKVISKQEK